MVNICLQVIQHLQTPGIVVYTYLGLQVKCYLVLYRSSFLQLEGGLWSSTHCWIRGEEQTCLPHSFDCSFLGTLSPGAWVLTLLQIFHPYPVTPFLFIEESLSIGTRHTKETHMLPILTSTGRVFHLQEPEGGYCICYLFIAIGGMPKKTT